MITLHHLERSRSHRVLWLLEELGLDYEVKTYARDPKTMLAPKAMIDVHPLGKSPVISDGDQVIAESGAIIEHLIDAHGGGRLAPKPEDQGRYRYWLHYAEGSLMPFLTMRLVFSKIPPGVPFIIRPIASMIEGALNKKYLGPQLKRHFDFIERSLDGDWFAGPEITGADIQMTYPLNAAAGRGVTGDRPRIAAFLDRVKKRPAYQRAIERGGPVEL